MNKFFQRFYLVLFRKRINKNCYQQFINRCEQLCLSAQKDIENLIENYSLRIDPTLKQDLFFCGGKLLKQYVILTLPAQLFNVLDPTTIAATLQQRISDIDAVVKKLDEYQYTEKKIVVVDHNGKLYIPDELKTLVQQSFSVQ